MNDAITKPGIETLFGEAIEIESPEERAAYIERACENDLALRGEVEKLVFDHFGAGDFLREPLAQIPVPPGIVTEGAGSQIGPYKLLQQIGEGGMGVVFMAEQARPVRRRVALKIIKPGMDTRQVIARFEAERQALALMDHPNIARVLDAGATESGRPYFVMELVKGVPITDYCDQILAGPRERLELFVPVCQAVAHAHQKGIIHRDLKPTNVMIALFDGKPVPKIIDFGVAKATNARLTEQTLFTEFGQIVGTIEYMSPEQAGLNELDVDTRSDIYSLGVLLYELLTGTTPLERKQVSGGAVLEMLRLVREEEPQKPSTRLTTMAGLHSIAASRGLDPKKLNGLVRGELDWIVMKCLDKQRERRYETAGEFAADLRRFLNDEAIQACPPSAWYKFRKWIWRHKAPVVAAIAATILLLTSVITLAVSNSWIREEQARTKAAHRIADERAEKNRADLSRLQSATSLQERGRIYFTAQHWDKAHAAFSKAVELRPDFASAWGERSDLAAHLGLWDLASDDIAREFTLREPDATGRWFLHALLRLHCGDTDGYQQVRRRMWKRFRGTSNPFFTTEVVRTYVLAADGNESLEPVVELARLTASAQPRSWYQLYILGVAQYRAGQYELAARSLNESLTSDPQWLGRAMSYPILAMANHRLGKAQEARQALDAAMQATNGWTQQLYDGSSRWHWVFHRGATAQWPIAWWDWVENQHYCSEAKRLIQGEQAIEDFRIIVLRARAFAGLGRYKSADVEYRAARALRPNDSQVRLETHRCAAYSAIDDRDFDRAATEIAHAIELMPDDADLWRFRAIAELGAGDLEGYRRTCRKMFERFEHTSDGRAAGNVLLACGLTDDALPDMSKLLPLSKTAASWHHVGGYVYGAALYRAGQLEESIKCLEAEANSFQPRTWEWSFLAMAHHRLGHSAEARRCVQKGALWIEAAHAGAGNDLSQTQPAWSDWQEPIAYPLLLREAQQLIEH